MALRQLTYSNRFIQEALYLDGTSSRCSSLESAGQQPPFRQPDTTTANGYRYWYQAHYAPDVRHQKVAIGYQNVVVLIDPQSFIDAIPYGTAPIGVALIDPAVHRIIASSGTFSDQIWPAARATSGTHLTLNNQRYALTPVAQDRLMVVTWASLVPLKKAFYHQLLFWVPFGLVISLLAAAIVSWVQHRLHSPRARLQEALRAKALVVHYQPVVSLESGNIVGAEALVRWPQPDGTLMSPDIFVPLAEESGLISQLTNMVAEKVVNEIGPWLHQHPALHIAVNLSADDLNSDTLLNQLNAGCARAGLAKGQIAIELTERAFARPDVSAPMLARFREAGYAVYIDDFGTGYSSLSYLEQFKVDVLKIDQSFVRAMMVRQQILSYIIDIARSLKLEMVAEGIETEDQARWLKKHGVQYGQGWLYSKALPRDAFIRWADQNLARASATVAP